MSKSTRKKLMIAFSFLLLTVSVFGLMALQLKDQGDRLQQQVEALAKDQNEHKARALLSETAIRTVDERLDLQNYFLLQEEDSISFLNYVESLAPQHGVVLSTNSLSVLDDNGEKWAEVSFSFSGTREQVQRFVKIMEELPYVIRVISIDLSAQSDTVWEGSVRLIVGLLAYET